MSRRPADVLEALPHHVYVHTDRQGEVIYVGRTSDPTTRPSDTKRRPWVATESSCVEVSPPMPFEVACWVEDQMILAINPKHNRRRGQTVTRADEDQRIYWLVEALGITRTSARTLAPYYPLDRAAFDEALVNQGRIEPRSTRGESNLARKS